MTRAEQACTTPGFLDLYRALWHYAKGRRLHVVVSHALLIGSQLVKLAIPWLTAQAINAIQLHGTGSVARAAVLILAIVLATVLSWAMHGPGRVIERTVAVHVRQRVSDRLYERVTGLPLAWHEKHHSGETLHRVEKTTHALSDFAGSQFIYLQNCVNLIGPVGALLLLSSVTGAMAIACYLAVALVIIRFDKALMRLVHAQNDAERRYSAVLVDALGNISTVLALRLQSATRALLGSRLALVFEPLRRSIVVNEVKWCAMDLLMIGATWAMVAAYAWSAHHEGGPLLLGNLFMVYQYATQAHGVMASVAMNYQNFSRMVADYASADPIWSATERQAPQGALPRDWQRIRVESLEFSYARNRRDAPLLKGASLELRRGERVALVGPSGSGKSTLMRVLAGLYDADRVRFEIDGIAHLGLRNLRPLATLIPQDAEVFEASLRDNITFGAPYPADAIADAVRIAQLEAVVTALPDGLDTAISERGLNFSGGQKQRLALARGILAARESSLVMLDEPTSSLDAMTEARVFGALSQAFPNARVVAAVHRLSLLGHFDRVVLMQDGAVIDSGSVDELLAREPLFAELWRRSVGAVETAAQAA